MVLASATLAAFFVTQRLKGTPPVLQRVSFYQFISPNGDGKRDTVTLRFRLPQPDTATVSVVDARGFEVRRLADARPLSRGTHAFVWNGRTPGGRVAPDGVYRLRVVLARRKRSVTAPRPLVLDRTPEPATPPPPARRGAVGAPESRR